ncbi:MAG: hypothetical protein KKH28_05795, partial [Elusimicrobia bacterium]|nr:hypothetical protein [Elusimicrobiota bacterium]
FPLTEKAALFGRSPHRPGLAAVAPARQAGRFVGPTVRALCPAPARPRAPLAAFGAKARANNRGLARKKVSAIPPL